MRIFSFTFCVLLGACGGSHDRNIVAGADASLVACMVEGGKAFEPTCEIQREISEQGLILTISSPGGGFRRLLVTKDGRGVIAADGAEPALVTPLNDGMVEVAVGSDRYRLPATVKASGKSQ